MELASIVASINKANTDKLSQADLMEWQLIEESLKEFKNGITTTSPWIAASAEDVNHALKIASDMQESKIARLPADNVLHEVLNKIREDFPDSLIHQATALEYVSKGLQQLNRNQATLKN